MEKKVVHCSSRFVDEYVSYYTLFGYKLIEKKEQLFSRSRLSFEREEVNQEVNNVEMKYHLHPSLTLFPMIFGCLAIVILTTLFLIFALSHKDDKLLYFIYFMIPALSVLLLISGYSYLRYSFDSKNIAILSNLSEIKKELGAINHEQERKES